jgi:hypothetical protein
MNGSGRIYGLVETLAERAQMADMIQMVMCDEHSRKRISIKLVFLKSLLQTSQAHTCIYQYSSIIRTEIIAVSAASAG